MDPASLVRKSDFEWWIPATGRMRVPGVIYASEALIRDMDEKVREGGIVSAGGVGFDISCGVRTLLTGLTLDAIEPVKRELATALSRSVPAGVGSHGRIHLDAPELDAMLTGGAQWAVELGMAPGPIST